ncbi:hypothetical protein [Lapillicoccus sp.]|uniref:hypothetical protein n=1 Tax=Lapillicoccus sp. TaxID=1909287 RepID=UPI0025D32B6C|nr:hypothetical protein [Lapillicoccus sp.]
MTLVAVWLLTACGSVIFLIGAYFIAARPSLLPEDARYMGSTVEGLIDVVPGLSGWLRRVFWVLGGFAGTTGVLVVYVAQTSLSSNRVSGLLVPAAVGAGSVGWMTVVNFMIRSAFRWALLTLCGLWALGLLAGLTAR